MVTNEKNDTENFSALHPLQILLAEDNRISRRINLTILKQLGYDPDVTNHGAKLLEMVHQKNYDLVLLESNLPPMGCLDVLAQLQKTISSSKLCPTFIVLSASNAEHEPSFYFKEGMDGCLHKPLSLDALKKALIEISKQGQNKGQAQPSLLNTEQLYAMLGNDSELVKKIVHQFITDAPKQLEEMEQALAEKDWKELALLAHGFKSNIALFGATTLTAQCKELEIIAQKPEEDGAVTLFKAIKTAFFDLQVELKALQ